MQRRRSSPRSTRRLRLILLATATLVSSGGFLRAETPPAPETQLSAAPIPAERPGDELELLAPLNSTLEFRVARRPWLLEKLTKPATEPGVKMNPPKPPAADIPDPPSSKNFFPDSATDSALGDVPNSRVDRPALNGRTTGEKTAEPTPSAQVYDDGWQPRESMSLDEASPAQETLSPPETSSPQGTLSPHETLSPFEAPADATPALEVPIEDPTEATIEPLPPLVQDEMDAEEETEESDTEQNADTEQKSPESVTVRPLRINRDGSPVDGDEVQDATRDGDAREREAAKAEQRVGDLDSNAPSGSKPARKLNTPVESARPQEAKRPDESIGLDAKDGAALETIPANLDYTGRPATPIRLNNSVARMQGMMKQCLLYYYARPENANERSNWGMLHSIMIYRGDTKIVAGRKTYSAIAWMAGNNPSRGQKMLVERDGRIMAESGIGLQGHQAQMLAIFGLCDVPPEYPLYAGNRKFTVQDLVKEEMLACKSGQELTFTLIGLSHYLDTETVWKNAEGETWDFQRLIREELAQPIVGAACGGTHRLMGFSHALRKRRVEGRPIEGQWKRAEVYGQDFISYAYRLQNRDGSMSTDWFEGREDNGDLDRKIQTTGHIVEWLLSVTPDSQLQDPKLVAAVRFLLTTIYNDREHEWEVGPKGHALRSLAIYYERAYKQGPAWRSTGVAAGNSRPRR